MYSKFLIALSSILLLFSLHLRGELAWAHAYPAVSVPNNGATVKEPPREVRIQFTEGVEIAFSQITVKTANGDVVSQGKLRQLAEDTLAIDLKATEPGELHRRVAGSFRGHPCHRRLAAVRGRGGRKVISHGLVRSNRVRDRLRRPRASARRSRLAGLSATCRRAQSDATNAYGGCRATWSSLS